MLSHVHIKNMMPTQKTVCVVDTMTGARTSVSTAAGVLSVAKQVTSVDRECSLAHNAGIELVFANTAPHPRVSVMRHTALGIQPVQHIDIHTHTYEVVHCDHTRSVEGLEGAVKHLMCKGHRFVGPASPLPFAMPSHSSDECRQHIRAMCLHFPHRSTPARGAERQKTARLEVLLRALGEFTETPSAPVAHTTHAVGLEKYRSFFMFNNNMISRLTATHTLSYARGICLNLAFAAHMYAGEDNVVQAETLTQASVSVAFLQSLRALRQCKPCAFVDFARPDAGTDEKPERRAVYDASTLNLSFVMFSGQGTPVVVGGDWVAGDGQPAPSATSRATADMLYLHAATASDTMYPLRLTLKHACYEKHASLLNAQTRAVLRVLSREDSPGIYSMAANAMFAHLPTGEIHV